MVVACFVAADGGVVGAAACPSYGTAAADLVGISLLPRYIYTE